MVEIKLTHIMIELTSEQPLNFSIISKGRDDTFAYRRVLERNEPLSFQLSNLDEATESVHLLVFKPNYVPEEKTPGRLLADSGKSLA